MAIAIALVALLLASVLFHFLSPWYLTPLASNWGWLDRTISISFWVTGIVFIAVTLFMVYSIVRYRYRSDRRSHYEPENKRLELWLTVVTTIGIAALLAPGLLVWRSFVSVPEDAQRVEVVGQQWHWSFRYPGEDGKLGAVDTRLIDGDNRFGMVPDDPAGRDDKLVRSPRAVLPLDQPVKLVLRSKDVLHNFQVAQFRAKMDMVPGQVSYMWLTPTRTGEFEILCAELCGIGHFAMRGMVEVVEPDRFESWLDEQPTYAEVAAREPGDPSAGESRYATCTACHGPQGQGNKNLNAPKLAGLEPWYIIRQLENFKTGERGYHPEDTYGKQMQSFAKQLPNRAAMADVAAYVQTFPDSATETTIAGNSQHGREIYRTCGQCHGDRGQGSQRHNAPRLAGMSDWYLVRQLKNFKQGIRGDHPDDFYGEQMSEMAKTLITNEAIGDVIAHINTLPQPSETARVAQQSAGRNH